MIDADLTQLRRVDRLLRTVSDRAIPFAVKNTINSAVRDVQINAREHVREHMTIRSPHTVRSIQFEPNRTLRVNTMAAIVGSTERYMETQEFGGTNTSQGKEGVPLPTGYSANQEGQRPRTKLPTRPNKLRNIQLRRRARFGVNRGQANVAKIQEAAETGKRYVYLDINGRTKGIFRVKGTSRGRKRIKMVYNMSKKSYTIPARPWLKPSVDKTAHKMLDFYERDLNFQLRRLRNR